MTDLEYQDAKESIIDLSTDLPIEEFTKHLYWIVFSHHDEECMYACSMEVHSSFIGGGGA